MPALRLRSSILRRSPLALGVALALGISASARAQSLFDLYEAARGFDAPYLAARALADSAIYRAEQAHAARRPSVSVSAGVARTSADNTTTDSKSTGTTAALQGSQSLFNRANDATIAQADRGVEVA